MLHEVMDCLVGGPVRGQDPHLHTAREEKVVLGALVSVSRFHHALSLGEEVDVAIVHLDIVNFSALIDAGGWDQNGTID